MTHLQDPSRLLHRTAERLAEHYEGTFSPETVERVVFESYATLRRTARITDHLPGLAEHFAKDRLKALARSKHNVDGKEHPTILFVSVRGEGRSQLAAAITRHLAGDRVTARSAGSLPGSEVPQPVRDALAEIGVDAANDYPKPLTDDIVRASDVIVTLGCGDACHLYEGKRYEDWQIDDPVDLDPDGVRHVRDEIRVRVEELLDELLPAAAAWPAGHRTRPVLRDVDWARAIATLRPEPPGAIASAKEARA